MVAAVFLMLHSHPQLFLHPKVQENGRSGSVAAAFLHGFGKSSTASAGDMGEGPSEGEDGQGWPCERYPVALHPNKCTSVLTDFPCKRAKLSHKGEKNIVLVVSKKLTHCLSCSMVGFPRNQFLFGSNRVRALPQATLSWILGLSHGECVTRAALSPHRNVANVSVTNPTESHQPPASPLR